MAKLRLQGRSTSANEEKQDVVEDTEATPPLLLEHFVSRVVRKAAGTCVTKVSVRQGTGQQFLGAECLARGLQMRVARSLRTHCRRATEVLP